MARAEKTRTHLENLVLTAQAAHGDASGDSIFQINTLNDDVNNATAVFSISNQGVTTISGGAGSAPGGGGAGQAVLRVQYDALAYATITQADGAGVTFNSVSDGTAGFTFSDPLTVTAATAQLTIKYDALAYMTITQADGAGVTLDSVSDGTAGFTFSDPMTVTATTAQLTIKYDTLAYMTITQADGAGVTFDSVSDGTASFTFSDPVTVNATGTTGTVRAIIGSMSAGASAAATNLVGVRGVVTHAGNITGTDGIYYYGTQGKFITGAYTLNNAAIWACGVFAQLDVSAATTWTSVQVAGLWVDMGATAHANAKTAAPTMVDCVRVYNTISGFLPNSIVKVIANSTYFMDLACADGVAGWYDTGTGTSASCTGHLKIKLAGTDAYLRVYQTAS